MIIEWGFEEDNFFFKPPFCSYQIDRISFLLVVIAATDDDDAVFFDLVDQPVLFGDAAGPAAGQLELQPLGFADALLLMAQDVPEQLADALHDLLVIVQKPFKILPGLLRKLNLHRSSAGKSISSPHCACFKDFSRCARWAGELSK